MGKPHYHPATFFLAIFLQLVTAYAEYPVQRPHRTRAVAAEGNYAVFSERPKQLIKGLGFEIQCDSIASGNTALPEETTSVPHDLAPPERERFYNEMLKGFRYCRLAGGLYWRGEDDPNQKQLLPRWPEQLAEIRDMIRASGVEGVSFEYWSPSPYWKANRKYTGRDGSENVLRCWGSKFSNDPDYHGDTNRFLNDFAAACGKDLKTLREIGIPISLWGLQNEPNVDQRYSSCLYTRANYAQTFISVAPAIRSFDPKIMIIADTANLGYINAVLKKPEESKYVDALVVHHVGSDSSVVDLLIKDTNKPKFQNEYEYLAGPASPDRCLNTVQHIMNWFQLGGAPTWFWIHALKPIGNAEASGYSLGFWKPANDTNPTDSPQFPSLKPGCWIWNKYNWHAVGSFIRHMPWDCRALDVKEDVSDPDLRILAYKKPDGKVTIVLSNSSGNSHLFHVNTGLLASVSFKGYRYTPDSAGLDFKGREIGTQPGPILSPLLSDRTWEFWEQQ